MIVLALYMAVLTVVPVTMIPMQPTMMEVVNTQQVAVIVMATQPAITVIVMEM